jgi:hypothetical protein
MQAIRRNQFFIAGLLFIAAAGVTAFGQMQNTRLALIWLALAVAFLGIGWWQRRSGGRPTSPDQM